MTRTDRLWHAVTEIVWRAAVKGADRRRARGLPVCTCRIPHKETR